MPRHAIVSREEWLEARRTDARGLDLLVGAYNDLDLTPRGRAEGALAFTMAGVRHHDRCGASTATGKE